jgi:hypothetical protein
MKHREYAKKTDEEKRVVVSFSLSGDRIKRLRQKFFEEHGRQPTEAECRYTASDVSLKALDEYLGLS